jgi:VWFA-related protein
MIAPPHCFKPVLSFSLLLLYAVSRPVYPQAQTPPPGQKQQAEPTIRVKVGLVQTDVMVFDRQGHFVPDLKLDQFELRVDGKVQPISFMELVSAGSLHDQEIWAKEEGKPAPQEPAAASSNPGRTLLFFVDDWHLSADSVMRSRAALTNLINLSMSPKDRVAIFAASGQLGTTQELTGDKNAVLASLERFNFKSAGVEDLAWPPMTEGQAFLIEQKDQDVILYFVAAMQRSDPYTGMQRFSREPDPKLVREICDRAAQLANLSTAIGERTLSALRDLVRMSTSLPGRKAIFFLSDGFVLQTQRSDIADRLRQLTDSAARAGIVIYSLDTRGLLVGLPDAKTKRAPDTTGALARSGYSEVMPQQDALNALAADTGGRFLKNTNALDTALITTLAEISRYYLLAWPFDLDAVKPGKYSTIRVAVKGRPGLTVRVRQGQLDLSQLVSKKPPPPPAPPERTPASELAAYANTRSVVDLTVDELLKTYPKELRDLRFEENNEELDLLLKKVGERVETFFHDFPNTVSKEQIRLERSNLSTGIKNSVTQNFNYSFYPDKDGYFWEETRMDSKGRPLRNDQISGFSFLTWGFAGMCMLFHPRHQFGSRFRYLGKQISGSHAEVIAFAQKPESGDVLGTYLGETMVTPALIMYQGLVWVDPETYQIVRMRTDLLAPRNDIGLSSQTSEIWFSEVRFKSIPQTFWLPREVVVTSVILGQMCRNTHRYSDHQVFTVETQEKIEPPPKKKEARSIG